MINDFSKTLFGYNKKDVISVIEDINNEFESELTGYKLQEKELKRESLKLTNEINQLNEKLKEYNSLNDRLTEFLYSANNPAYEAERNLDEMIALKNETIKKLEEENEKVSTDIIHLMKRINDSINKQHNLGDIEYVR